MKLETNAEMCIELCESLIQVNFWGTITFLGNSYSQGEKSLLWAATVEKRQVMGDFKGKKKNQKCLGSCKQRL